MSTNASFADQYTNKGRSKKNGKFSPKPVTPPPTLGTFRTLLVNFRATPPYLGPSPKIYHFFTGSLSILVASVKDSFSYLIFSPSVHVIREI